MRLEDKYPELYRDLQSYIGENMVAFNREAAFSRKCKGNITVPEFAEFAGFGDIGVLEDSEELYDEVEFDSSEPLLKEMCMPEGVPDFTKMVEDKKTFTDVLMEHIKTSNMTNVQIYNNACMSRQSYSKIVYGDVIPKKSSVLALAIALKLSIKDTEDLLSRAGHSLVESDLADTIVKYFIENEMYDIFIVNEFLDHYQQKLLGNVVG